MNKISGNCKICGVYRKSLERDHILPKWKGGLDDPDNIQYLCSNCHRDKTAKDLLGKPGPVYTEEGRQRQSIVAKLSWARGDHDVPHMHGKHHTPDAKAKIAAARQGKPLPKETRDKIRAALAGRQFSNEHKNKLSSVGTLLWQRRTAEVPAEVISSQMRKASKAGWEKRRARTPEETLQKAKERAARYQARVERLEEEIRQCKTNQN